MTKLTAEAKARARAAITQGEEQAKGRILAEEDVLQAKANARFTAEEQKLKGRFGL